MDSSFLLQSALFQGIREEELQTLLRCLHARERAYPRDSLIFRAGEPITELGLLLSGSVNILVHHYWGGRQIFGHIEAGDLFGETYAAIPGKELLVDVTAAEDCRVLFVDMGRLLTTCQSGCGFHNRIIRNLIRISAAKNLSLSSRMLHTAPRTIRERLLSYLSQQAQERGSSRFRIPFSRQQLADYLGVDRSALSNELSKMQRDGLLRCRKNEFQLEKHLER